MNSLKKTLLWLAFSFGAILLTCMIWLQTRPVWVEPIDLSTIDFSVDPAHKPRGEMAQNDPFFIWEKHLQECTEETEPYEDSCYSDESDLYYIIPWDLAQVPKTKQFLLETQQAVNTLLTYDFTQQVYPPRCISFDEDINYVIQARNCTEVLCLHLYNNLAHQQYDKSLRIMQAICSISNTIDHGGTLINHLVALSIRGALNRVLEAAIEYDLLNNPDGEKILSLNNTQSIQTLNHTFRHEYNVIRTAIASLFDNNGKDPDLGDGLPFFFSIAPLLGSSKKTTLNNLDHFWGHLITAHTKPYNFLSMQRIESKFEEFQNAPYLYDDTIGLILTAYMTPAVSGARNSHEQVVSQYKLLQIAQAIHQQTIPPQELSELSSLDIPRTIRYNIQTEGLWTLYDIGFDNVDNNGDENDDVVYHGPAWTKNARKEYLSEHPDTHAFMSP